MKHRWNLWALGPALLTAAVQAQGDAGPTAVPRDPVPPQVQALGQPHDRSVALADLDQATLLKGLDRLVSLQLGDGRWTQGDGAELDDLEATLWAILALTGGGSTQAAGPHQEPVREAVAWVQMQVSSGALERPFQSSDGGEPAALTALALAEAWGPAHDGELPFLQTAVDALLGQRTEHGVWGIPGRQQWCDPDRTTRAIHALAVARAAGAKVPDGIWAAPREALAPDREPLARPFLTHMPWQMPQHLWGRTLLGLQVDADTPVFGLWDLGSELKGELTEERWQRFAMGLYHAQGSAGNRASWTERVRDPLLARLDKWAEPADPVVLATTLCWVTAGARYPELSPNHPEPTSSGGGAGGGYGGIAYRGRTPFILMAFRECRGVLQNSGTVLGELSLEDPLQGTALLLLAEYSHLSHPLSRDRSMPRYVQGCRFLLAQQTGDGLFAEDPGDHALITHALATARIRLGEDRSPTLNGAVLAGLRALEGLATPIGGYGGATPDLTATWHALRSFQVAAGSLESMAERRDSLAEWLLTEEAVHALACEASSMAALRIVARRILGQEPQSAELDTLLGAERISADDLFTLDFRIRTKAARAAGGDVWIEWRDDILYREARYAMGLDLYPVEAAQAAVVLGTVTGR